MGSYWSSSIIANMEAPFTAPQPRRRLWWVFLLRTASQILLMCQSPRPDRFQESGCLLFWGWVWSWVLYHTLSAQLGFEAGAQSCSWCVLSVLQGCDKRHDAIERTSGQQWDRHRFNLGSTLIKHPWLSPPVLTFWVEPDILSWPSPDPQQIPVLKVSLVPVVWKHTCKTFITVNFISTGRDGVEDSALCNKKCKISHTLCRTLILTI